MGDSLTGTPEFDTGAGFAFEAEPPVDETDQALWQMRSNLDLAPMPSAVPCARAHARLVLAEWGLARLSNEVELVVSELVTNSVRAAAGLVDSWFVGRWIPGTPPVRLWLASDCRQVLVRVWDGNHELPFQREANPEGHGGRGLLLVESLSIQWGVYRPLSYTTMCSVDPLLCDQHRSHCAFTLGTVVPVSLAAGRAAECLRDGR